MDNKIMKLQLVKTETPKKKLKKTKFYSTLFALPILSLLAIGCPNQNTPTASLPEAGKAPSVPVLNENIPPPATTVASTQTNSSEKLAQNSTATNTLANVASSLGQNQASETTPSDLANSTRISGTVLSGKAGMMSFTPAGRIAKMIVRVGDRVHKGQTLAILDASDFEFRERLAVAAQSQAKVQFDQAKRDLEREEQLKKENVTSVASLERMSNAFTAAKAAMEQTQVNLEMARKSLQDTKLPAPYDGVVTKKVRSDGEWVAAGAAVYELYEIGETEVSLRIPESFLKKAQVGKTLNIMCPSTGVKAPARIVRVVPIVQEATRTFEVLAQFTKSGVQIYPGQFVEADLN